MRTRIFLVILNVFICLPVHAETLPAATKPIPIAELAEYDQAPKAVQEMFLKAEKLSAMNLTYQFASADPKNKGMDCSGTMYYLLNQMSVKDVPRSSDEQFSWIEKHGKLYRITQQDFNSPEFSHLKPGDLLFWSGTYATKNPASISHVMLYLGKTKDGERLMFGASNGRSYQHKKMWGVSVFDFTMPGEKKSRFIGYSCIPELTC